MENANFSSTDMAELQAQKKELEMRIEELQRSQQDAESCLERCI
jgi:hypothetical protein